jgi:hypothetical protein
VLTARETLERRLGVDRVAAEPEAMEEIIYLCGRLPLALASAGGLELARPCAAVWQPASQPGTAHGV